VAGLLGRGAARLIPAAGATARLEAEILLAHAARVRREWLMAHPDSKPSAGAARWYASAIERRRTDRIPVAYLTGVREFMGLRFAMRIGVFIPRPETEGLVERVEAWLRPRLPLAPGEVVVDACTGSGAIAVALARRLGVRVVATDRSGAAVALARRNASRLGVGRLIRVIEGDGILGVGASLRVVAVVSNPPYVREALWPRLARDIRAHEPRGALTAGRDGLAMVRRLLRQAGVRVVPGGLVALEIAPGQRRAVLSMLGRDPWDGGRVETDLAGRDRYALAFRKTLN
jgi:release factor glutamine methyltransferase